MCQMIGLLPARLWCRAPFREAEGCYLLEISRVCHASQSVPCANAWQSDSSLCNSAAVILQISHVPSFLSSLDQGGYMLVQKFADESQEIPRPENWGGYLIRPKAIEFWHGRPSRLHDRICFRKENGAWKQERLAP